MDLFVELPGREEDQEHPEHLVNLERLYNTLQMSSLAQMGTLHIVRGARVPIVKYIDSQGSGIILKALT